MMPLAGTKTGFLLRSAPNSTGSPALKFQNAATGGDAAMVWPFNSVITSLNFAGDSEFFFEDGVFQIALRIVDQIKRHAAEPVSRKEKAGQDRFEDILGRKSPTGV